MQEWGVVGPAQLICRPGSHPDVHQQARVETGRGCFPFHSLLHPSFTTHTATMLAVASFFTNYQLCKNAYANKEGEKKSREVWFHRFFPTTIFKAEDDTTLGNKHLLGCVCSLKGLVSLPRLWVIRLFNAVLVDIRGGLAGFMGFTVMLILWPCILKSVPHKDIE